MLIPLCIVQVQETLSWVALLDSYAIPLKLAAKGLADCDAPLLSRSSSGPVLVSYQCSACLGQVFSWHFLTCIVLQKILCMHNTVCLAGICVNAVEISLTHYDR